MFTQANKNLLTSIIRVASIWRESRFQCSVWENMASVTLPGIFPEETYTFPDAFHLTSQDVCAFIIFVLPWTLSVSQRAAESCGPEPVRVHSTWKFLNTCLNNELLEYMKKFLLIRLAVSQSLYVKNSLYMCRQQHYSPNIKLW